MSIYRYKNSKNWWIKLSLGNRKFRCVPTGTPDKEKAVAIQATLNMARRRATPAEILHRLIDELCGTEQTVKQPLAGAIDTYNTFFHTTGRKVSPRTMNNRRLAFSRFLAWQKVKYPAAITAAKVDRACAVSFAKHLLDEGLASKSRLNIITDLATIWEGLICCTDEVKTNPWKLVRPEDTDSEPGKPFSEAQVEAVLKAADTLGRGWGLACRIALYTGLRFGDVATLEWEDIDLAQALIRIRPNKTKRHGVEVIMPIAPKLLEILKALPGREGFLMPQMGNRYPFQMKHYPFRRVLEDSKIDHPEEYTFHSFRHTFRTRLGEAGVSGEIAKRLGGWTNDKMSEHYDHSERVEELREAIHKIHA